MWSQTGHRWQYNMQHELWIQDKYGYRHTLRICNTYCFSTATMVIRLLVKLYVHCLSFILRHFRYLRCKSKLCNWWISSGKYAQIFHLKWWLKEQECFSSVCDYYVKVCTKCVTSLYLGTNMITYDALHKLIDFMYITEHNIAEVTL